MNEIASKGQLRLSYLRWALVTVPAILFLGFLMAKMSNSGSQNRWYAGLVKPEFMPADWVFPVAWTVLYVMMALALAIIIHARGARMRGLAIGLFLVQLVANLAWSPLFFRAHMVIESLYLLVFILVAATITTIIFARIRIGAALMMLPYLVWLGFAGALNYSINDLNPDASSLVVPVFRSQI